MTNHEARELLARIRTQAGRDHAAVRALHAAEKRRADASKTWLDDLSVVQSALALTTAYAGCAETHAPRGET